MDDAYTIAIVPFVVDMYLFISYTLWKVTRLMADGLWFELHSYWYLLVHRVSRGRVLCMARHVASTMHLTAVPHRPRVRMDRVLHQQRQYR